MYICSTVYINWNNMLQYLMFYTQTQIINMKGKCNSFSYWQLLVSMMLKIKAFPDNVTTLGKVIWNHVKTQNFPNLNNCSLFKLLHLSLDVPAL